MWPQAGRCHRGPLRGVSALGGSSKQMFEVEGAMKSVTHHWGGLKMLSKKPWDVLGCFESNDHPSDAPKALKGP